MRSEQKWQKCGEEQPTRQQCICDNQFVDAPCTFDQQEADNDPLMTRQALMAGSWSAINGLSSAGLYYCTMTLATEEQSSPLTLRPDKSEPGDYLLRSRCSR